MLREAHLQSHVEGHRVLHLREGLDDGDRLVDGLVRAAAPNGTSLCQEKEGSGKKVVRRGKNNGTNEQQLKQ